MLTNREKEKRKERSRVFYEKNRERILAKQSTPEWLEGRRRRYMTPERLEAKRERDRKAEENKRGPLRRRRLLEAKTPCIACGEMDKTVIQFHHPDERHETGRHKISAYAGGSEERWQEALKEVVCLCGNCHIKVHAGTLVLLK